MLKRKACKVGKDHEPTILTISAAHSPFVVAQPLGILWMKDLTKAFRHPFFFHQAGFE
jgi:hypothetical protein